MLLVAIYLRVSTEEQASKGYSLAEQRAACRHKAQALAAEHARQTGELADLELVEFVDDFGGDIAGRPALEALRTFVRERRPAWVVCMDPDRFSRSLKLQLIVADAIEAQQTRLAFVQQEYDPSDIMSKAFFQFRGLMSELDKAKILERTARGKRGKMKAGKRPNGAAPFGYIHNRETDHLEICEPEAAWVRRIFSWVADDHLSVHRVAERLNALGVPCKRNGTRWFRSVVRGLLQNTTYYGEMRCNRKDFQGLGAIRRLPRSRRRPLSARVRPQEEWVLIPVPALVDRLTWDRAQASLQATTRRGGRRDTGLLSMLLVCGLCGSSMSYARRTGGRHYIRCQRRYAGAGAPQCTNPHHRAERVEAAAWSRLTALPTRRETVPDEASALQRLQGDLRVLREQLEAQIRVQAVTVQRQARGQLCEAAADTLLAESNRQISQLQAEIVALEERRDSAAADQVHEFPGWLEGVPPHRRRELILRAVKRVAVHPDGTVSLMLRDDDRSQDC